MVDSSEKVSFRVDMQCSSLRAEAFLVFDKGSQPTLGQQSADCWQTIFLKGGSRQLADCFWGDLFFTFSIVRMYFTKPTIIISNKSWEDDY